MQPDTYDAIRSHALADYPREACGLIVTHENAERYVPCRNLAAGPREQFVLAPEDFAAAEDAGEVLAVVHSHPDAPARPSEGDRAGCEASGLPWYILEVRGQDGAPRAVELHRFEPAGWRAPLLGRPFFHGVLDCWSIVRDWFERERGIALRDFARDDGWWETERELYLDGYPHAGFVPVPPGDPPRTGDMILMQIRSPRVNHAGLFLGEAALSEAPDLHPVPNAMIHHLYGRLSERTVYGGMWAQATRLIVRHKEFIND